jgi:SAM-dependent methyltransferase
MMVDKELVKTCYEVILGRQPESDDVVAAHAQATNAKELLERFVSCEEFLSKPSPSYTQQYKSVQDIEVHVSADLLDRMFERIQKQWSILGEKDPYWSVLTSADFKVDNVRKNQENFFTTGQVDAALVDAFHKRVDLRIPFGTCLELGCGVGRVTRYLASRFDKIIGVDISPGNLELARRYLKDNNISNVELILLRSIKEIQNLPSFDYLYSFIVLQHNPPPVQYLMLENLFGKVRTGGGCLFQIPTDVVGYKFNAKEYLRSKPPVMETHSLPMPAVLDLMQRNGLLVKDVRPDYWIGVYGSFTFLGGEKSDPR